MMLRRTLALLLVAAAPGALWAQATQGTQAPLKAQGAQGVQGTGTLGVPVVQSAPDIKFREGMQTKNGFSAELRLTSNKAIFEEITPNPDHLEPVEVVRRGASIYTVVLFANAASRFGKVDLTYDIVIKKPDGSVYGEGKNLAGWKGRGPATPGLVHVASGTVKIQIDPEDPNGKYLVAAVIRDNARGVSILSEQTFEVR